MMLPSRKSAASGRRRKRNFVQEHSPEARLLEVGTLETERQPLLDPAEVEATETLSSKKVKMSMP